MSGERKQTNHGGKIKLILVICIESKKLEKCLKTEFKMQNKNVLLEQVQVMRPTLKANFKISQ